MPEIPDALYEAAARAYVSAIESRYGWSAGKVDFWANESTFRAAIDAVAPLLIAEGRRQAAEAIRAQADDVPYIPLRNGARLKAGSAVAWAATIAEGVDDA